MSSTAWLILTIVGALGSAACLYGIYGDKKRGYLALKAVDSQFEMPDMRFRYTPEELFACLEKLGTEGRQRLRRLWGLDSALALFLVLVLAVVSHNLAAFRWLRWAMYGLAVLRSLLDFLENGLLLRVCTAYPSRRLTGTAKAASVCTMLKWAAAVLWVAGMFGAALVRAYVLGK